MLHAKLDSSERKSSGPSYIGTEAAAYLRPNFLRTFTGNQAVNSDDISNRTITERPSSKEKAGSRNKRESRPPVMMRREPPVPKTLSHEAKEFSFARSPHPNASFEDQRRAQRDAVEFVKSGLKNYTKPGFETLSHEAEELSFARSPHPNSPFEGQRRAQGDIRKA